MPAPLTVGDVAPTPPEALRSEADIMRSWGDRAGPPLVSVRCTTYNHRGFIAEALRGFLIQETSFPFNVVVHDDASTDGTADIVEDFQRRYPRIIQFVRQRENLYSQGLKFDRFLKPHLTGRYLATCEGDDYWMDPRKLEIQVGFLERHPEFVVSFHDTFVRDEEHVSSASLLAPHERRDRSVADMKRGRAWVPTLTRVYRNVPLDPVFETRFIQNGDVFTLARLAAHGAARFHADIAPACYRRHAGGISSLVGGADGRAARLSTRLWMARYFRRIGDDATARALDDYVAGVILNDVPLPRLVRAVGRRVWRAAAGFARRAR